MITPLDIENKKFSKQMMNGYNVDEVDDFLDEIMEDYESNYKELATLRPKVDEFLDELGIDFAKKYKELNEANKQIEDLNNSLEHYKTIESTLQNTLVMAQSTAEEVKNVAKQQADQIIVEAKSLAQKEVDNLDRDITLKRKELEDLQKQFDIYKAKMESLLISQLELLKEINKDND